MSNTRFEVSYLRIILLFLVVAIVLHGNAFSFVFIIVSFIFLIVLTNRYEFAITTLIIGLSIVGAVNYYLGIPLIGKFIGLLCIYILRNTIINLRSRADILLALLFSILLTLVFYLIGPMTPVSTAKLISISYNAFIFLIAFHALMMLSKIVRFEYIALWTLFYSVLYLLSVDFFEISKHSLEIMKVSGLREARGIIISASRVVGDINLVGDEINYQLLGNAAALALVLLSCEYFLINRRVNPSFDWIIFVCICMSIIIVSGSRQSFMIVIISVSSCLLINGGVRKYLVKSMLALLVLLLGIVLIVGFANDTSSIVSLLNAKDFSSTLNRDTNFDAAIELIQDKPLLGFGLGGYFIPSEGMLPGEVRRFPHNVILELWSEMGFIGMISFLSFWVCLYFKALYIDDRKSIFSSFLPGDKTLIPLVAFYTTAALMNDILERSIALFILVALYFTFIKSKRY